MAKLTKAQQLEIDELQTKLRHAMALQWRDLPHTAPAIPARSSVYIGFVPLLRVTAANMISVQIMHAASTANEHVISTSKIAVETWRAVKAGTATKEQVARCPTGSRDSLATYCEWTDALKAGRLMLQEACAKALAQVDHDIAASAEVDTDSRL